MCDQKKSSENSMHVVKEVTEQNILQHCCVHICNKHVIYAKHYIVVLTCLRLYLCVLYGKPVLHQWSTDERGHFINSHIHIFHFT